MLLEVTSRRCIYRGRHLNQRKTMLQNFLWLSQLLFFRWWYIHTYSNPISLGHRPMSYRHEITAHKIDSDKKRYNHVISFNSSLQVVLSTAASNQLFFVKSVFFSALYIPRPKVNSGAPTGRLFRTHEDSIFLGSLFHSILDTCPAHRSWWRITYASADIRPARFSSSLLLMWCNRVCFLVILNIHRMHLLTKTLSFWRSLYMYMWYKNGMEHGEGH